MASSDEIEGRLLIDRVCDEYETALKRGDWPDPTTISPADLPAEHQADLLEELLRIEAATRRAG